METEDEYQNLDTLGSGRFGVVKKVMCVRSQKLFACKVIRFRPGEISREDAEREYSILSRLNHPNIVKYVDYRWRPDKAKLYMEYCPEGNLLDIIKKSQITGSHLSEVLIWSALAQLASALMYCHYGVRTSWDGSTPVSYPTEEWDPVIHRDIKPANVLVSSSTNDYILVKLGDFGLSKVIDSDNAPASYAGTPQYQPPEIARSHPTGIRWTKKCDVFSLGCTLYQMCAWRPPFSYRMEESDVFDDIPELYSDRLRKCIAVCIAFHSEDRHDAFDLLRVIQRARNDPSTHGAKGKKAEEEEEDDAAKDEPSGSSKVAKDKEADDDDKAEEKEADVHFEPLVRLTEKVETRTNEEAEEQSFKMRAKLFKFDRYSNEWKDRGTGDVRLMKHTENGKTRLVMRQDKTLKVCANHYVTPDMKLSPNISSDRSWVWRVAADVSEGEPEALTLAIRFLNSENANLFKEAFMKAQQENEKLFQWSQQAVQTQAWGGLGLAPS